MLNAVAFGGKDTDFYMIKPEADQDLRMKCMCVVQKALPSVPQLEGTSFSARPPIYGKVNHQCCGSCHDTMDFPQNNGGVSQRLEMLEKVCRETGLMEFPEKGSSRPPVRKNRVLGAEV